MKKLPPIADWFIIMFSPFKSGPNILGDITEFYNEIYSESGHFRANIWCWVQIFKSLPKFFKTAIIWRFAMFRSYFITAYRNILRQKGYAFINITGLSVGLACCILMLLWVQDELSYDQFHKNAPQLYRVVQHIPFSDHTTTWGISQGPLARELKKDFPEIVESAIQRRANQFFIKENNTYNEIGIFTDPSFLSMFTFPFIHGDPSTALSNPNSIVLTQSLSEVIFGDANPIGKSLHLTSGTELTITGVMHDLPDNSTLDFRYIMPIVYTSSIDRWNNSGYYTWVMLDESADVDKISEAIAPYLDTQPTLEKGARLSLQPLTDIHLYSAVEYDFRGLGDFTYVMVFSIAAAFILLIACINFMNLSTARSTNRAKEVGMRKVSGAHRSDIIKQFFSESLLMTLLAMLISIVLIFSLLSQFNEISGKNFNFENIANLSLLGVLFLAAVLTGIIAGSYPALYLSSFRPVAVLKGAAANGSKSSGMRKFLVVTQFSLTTVLIVGTAVIYNQLSYMQNKNLGYIRENVMIIPIRGDMLENMDTVIEEMHRFSGVTDVSSVSNPPTSGFGFSNSLWEWEGKDPDQELLVRGVGINYNYFKTFGMKLAEGRAFSKKFPSDTSDAVIINEAAARAMGLADPIGKRLGNDVQTQTIIGVVKDYNFRSLHNPVEPLVLLFAPQWAQFLCVRINGDNVAETMTNIEKVWDAHVPSQEFLYTFMDDGVDQLYRAESRIGTIFNYFTGLAVLISCLGLFGLASFITEQRTKEIGIRKTLGSSTPAIVYLLSKEFMKWVAIANLIAWPIAWYAMNIWLENFAYKTDIGVVIFILSGFTAAVIALVTVSYQTIRAARSNPVDALKCE